MKPAQAGFVCIAAISNRQGIFEPQKVNIELQKVNIEHQKVNIEHQKVNIEHQKVNIELQKVNIEPQKVNIEPQKVNIELQKVNTELLKVNIELKSSRTYATGTIGLRAAKPHLQYQPSLVDALSEGFSLHFWDW